MGDTRRDPGEQAQDPDQYEQAQEGWERERRHGPEQEEERATPATATGTRTRTRTRARESGPPPVPRRGLYPSLKMGRNMPYTSTAQLQLLHLLDADPDVIGYTRNKADPAGTNDRDSGNGWDGADGGNPVLTIRQTYEGEMVTHTPDFLVQTRGYTALVDCMPKRQHTRRAERRMRAIVYAWAAQLRNAQRPTATSATSTSGPTTSSTTIQAPGAAGLFEYMVFDSALLQQNYYVHNLMLLAPYGRGTVRPGLRAELYSLLDPPVLTYDPHDRHAVMNIGELAAKLNPLVPDAAKPAIYNLAYHREILLPLAAEYITDYTLVYLRHQQPLNYSYPPPELRFPTRPGLPT